MPGRQVSKRPNILFVFSTLEVGGSETKVVNIANSLSEAGHAVGIAYLNPPDTLREKIKSGVSVSLLERTGKYSLKSLRALRTLIRERQPVLVGVNFYPLLYMVPAVLGLGRHVEKSIALINTTEFNPAHRMYGIFYPPIIRRCDQIVFGCKSQQDMWINKYRMPQDRSTFIYNGVDSEHFSADAAAESRGQFRSHFQIPEDALVIGSVGRFAPEKHFELLVESMARLRLEHRNVFLLIVGEGRQKETLKRIAEQRGVSDIIRFPGVFSDVRPALAAMDVFVLPSRAVETFSNAALEAMSMQRPVVLSDIGGAAEMIDDGIDGILFNSGDLEQLTDKLSLLLKSAERRDAYGLAARRRVVERFTYRNMVENYEKLLTS